eukprot:1157510-Pelagomonas_calceolata.AAC.26
MSYAGGHSPPCTPLPGSCACGQVEEIYMQDVVKCTRRSWANWESSFPFHPALTIRHGSRNLFEGNASSEEGYLGLARRLGRLPKGSSEISAKQHSNDEFLMT